ncbi:MAG: hypothetical protein DRJ61_15775 [Acidobacteria bacterium]|nr:MAG: hypothetical protein DRJ61_15775 [Acidobacteriota bacterium]
MASGRLGTADLSAATITDVYTVPSSTLASVNISVCNRNASAVAIRIAVSDTAVTQGNDEFIEYGASIAGNGVLERTGIALDATKIVTVYSDTANVSVVVTGIEEAV